MVWIAIGGAPAGMAALADEPRAGAAAAVKAMQGMNLRTAMLTGDNAGAAAAVGAAVGLRPEDIHAGLLPANKLTKARFSRPLHHMTSSWHHPPCWCNGQP